MDSIGVWRAVSKGVKDSCRPPALRACYSRNGLHPSYCGDSWGGRQMPSAIKAIGETSTHLSTSLTGWSRWPSEGWIPCRVIMITHIEHVGATRSKQYVLLWGDGSSSCRSVDPGWRSLAVGMLMLLWPLNCSLITIHLASPWSWKSRLGCILPLPPHRMFWFGWPPLSNWRKITCGVADTFPSPPKVMLSCSRHVKPNSRIAGRIVTS
jgi:hypothetical protein